MGNDEQRGGGASGPATSVIAKVKPKTKRPNLYRVLILNDDYTPMEFVVLILQQYFSRDRETATQIMLNTAFRMFPDSGAAQGKKGEAPKEVELTPEQIAFAQITQGIHW